MHKNNVIASEKKPLWYHCGRCGSLFQSVTHASKGHRCSECGFNPIPPTTDKNTQTLRFTKTINSVENIKKHSQNPVQEQVRRKKTKQYTIILAIFWMLAIGLIVFATKSIWGAKETTSSASKVSVINTSTENEDLALLNKYTSKCWDTLQKFLQAGLPEQRSQYVSQPVTAVTRMTRHQDFQGMDNISLPTLKSSQWSVVSIGAEKSIEGFWINEDGRCFDALFRKEQEEWLIDWECFVRYSEMPLAVFLSGNGDAEGEFRLLARERLAEDRKNQPTISIMLYSPVFGRPTETGAPSPEFLVQRNSPAGKLLEAAFAALKNKKRPFNAKNLNLDPEGMIRVRVKIRRSGEMEARAFEIVELKACHWYSTDLPGFDVDKEGEVKN